MDERTCPRCGLSMNVEKHLAEGKGLTTFNEKAILWEQSTGEPLFFGEASSLS